MRRRPGDRVPYRIGILTGATPYPNVEMESAAPFGSLSRFLSLLMGESSGTLAWMLPAFGVIGAALLLNLVLRRIFNRLHARALDSHHYWDDAVVQALRRPLACGVLVGGVGVAMEIAHDAGGLPPFAPDGALRMVVVVALLGWFLVRLVNEGERGIAARYEDKGEPYDRTTLDAIAKLLRMAVLVVASLVVLQTLGVSIAGVLAVGGMGGIAVGFAARDLLANFFGGLMIYLDRPFAVGDWIRSPDREIEGTVEQIGWRQTRIRTFDRRPLYVPNSVFTTIAVENPSRMQNRRIYETIGLRYDDAGKLAIVLTDVERMLRAHPEIDTKRILMVNFNTFAPSSLDFFVYTFTKETDWARFHRIKQDVLLKILDIIESHGAQAAFPTSTVHVPEALRLEPIDRERAAGAAEGLSDNREGGR